MVKNLLLLTLLMMIYCQLLAQPVAPQDTKIITLDLVKNTFSSPIPYDKPFHISGMLADATITELKLYIKEGDFGSGEMLETDFFISEWVKAGQNTFFTLMADVLPSTEKYLEADKYYAMEIVGKDASGTVRLDFRNMINTTTAAGDFIKMDFGVLYAPSPKMWSGEISAHLYALPVNDDADPANFKGFAQNVFKRSSLYFGLSVAKFKTDTKQDIKNFVGLGNIVYGLSFHSLLYGWYGRSPIARRIFQPMYVNIGQVLYKQADANPLIVKDRNKTSFYVGISYDFNFLTLFGPLTKIFTP